MRHLWKLLIPCGCEHFSYETNSLGHAICWTPTTSSNKIFQCAFWGYPRLRTSVLTNSLMIFQILHSPRRKKNALKNCFYWIRESKKCKFIANEWINRFDCEVKFPRLDCHHWATLFGFSGEFRLGGLRVLFAKECKSPPIEQPFRPWLLTFAGTSRIYFSICYNISKRRFFFRKKFWNAFFIRIIMLIVLFFFHAFKNALACIFYRVI